MGKSWGILWPLVLLSISYLILRAKNNVKTNHFEDPIKCGTGNSSCTVSNSYGAFPDRSICRAARVVYPANEAELIRVVRDATKTRTKMKVVTRYVHSVPKLVCPDGEAGLLISTNNLNKVLNINTTEGTITVESGTMLRQLIDEAAKDYLALPYTPYWDGLTVGGLLSTGAHGSSLWGIGSSVHDHLIQIRIVSPADSHDDYVKIRTLGLLDKDLDAVKVSLGVLGVISQVKFKLQPLFKRNITYEMKDDKDLGDEALTFGVQHEFGDITWLPSQGKAIYRIDDRVTVTTPGDGVYNSLMFQHLPAFQLQLFRKLDEMQESYSLEKFRCSIATKIASYVRSKAYGLTNDGKKFRGYPVIGYQNKMQTSGECLNTNQNSFLDSYCGWDVRAKAFFAYSNEFSLPLTKVNDFIQDIQQLVRIKPTSLCGLDIYYGILMRYVKASSAYLGKDKDVITFDISYYKPTKALGRRLFDDVLDEIEQIAIVKYGGLPHWGKNRNVAFVDVINKYKYGQEFIKVKEEYDRLGLFSSEWTDQILGLNGLSPIVKEVGCAREGLCVCSKNDDFDYCGIGYSCEDGLVYINAKVCRKNE